MKMYVKFCLIFSNHWIIRDGEVTSKGEHVAKESLSDSDTDSDSDSYIEYLEGVKRQIKKDRLDFKPVWVPWGLQSVIIWTHHETF